MAECALRIAVDMPWDSSAHMGTGSYSDTMVRALAEAAPHCSIHIISPETASNDIKFKNVTYHLVETPGMKDDSYRHLALPSLMERLHIDCLFSPATLLPLVKVCPMVTTVHDLTFLEHPEYYSLGLVKYLERNFEPALCTADHIVAISHETRQKLIEKEYCSSNRISVICQPIRECFKVRLEADHVVAVLSKLRIDRNYYLHVSNLAPHKNVRFALQVFKRFLQLHQSDNIFVVAGGGIAPNQQPDILAMANELGIKDRVRYVGRVSDEQLQALYQGCTAFLFPSLAEGWGLPVAEAMSCGAPVLASEFVPALPEDQRLKLDIEAWARALEQPPIYPDKPIDFREAGKNLFNIIVKLCSSSLALTRGQLQSEQLSKDHHCVEDIVLEAPWGLGDSLLLSGVALHIKDHVSNARIWLATWPGDLPRPDFVENGDPPRTSRRVKLGYGQTIDFCSSDRFPGTLTQRMVSDFVNQTGMDVPIPSGTLPPMIGTLPEKSRDPQTIAIMAHGTGINPAKEWGAQQYTRVSRLLNENGWRVVQIGSLKDLRIPGAVDRRSESISHTAGVLSGVALFLGEVGFLMHLASATKTPAAIVYGGREMPSISGYPEHLQFVAHDLACMGKWGCWLDNHVQCPYGHPCMVEIKPEWVASAIGNPPFRGYKPGPVPTPITHKDMRMSSEVFWERWQRIDGWLSFDEARFLQKIAHDVVGDIVEIGTYCGRSTAALASGRKMAERSPVIAIDHGAGSKEHDMNKFPEGLWPIAEKNLRDLQVWEYVEPKKCSSMEGSKNVLLSTLGAVFIDGGHSFDEVSLDISLWAPRVQKNGLILIHDYIGDWVEIKKATDSLAERMGLHFRGSHGSIGIFEKEELIKPNGLGSKRVLQLSGCMIIKNGIRLGYPFVEAVLAVINHVEEMVIVDGGSEDGTWDVLLKMAHSCAKIVLKREAWPPITEGGHVIAEATNAALKLCHGTHILYVQADEIHTEGNLKQLRRLLEEGYNSAALPFLHFRSSWWKVVANPHYSATLRCVPNLPDIISIGDGYSFGGPVQPCATPDLFSEPIFHVGWVYPQNIREKHKNHATLYTDLPEYQDKAKKATALDDNEADSSLIDSEFKLLWFKGKHPPVVQHLINKEIYDPYEGLKMWSKRFVQPVFATCGAKNLVLTGYDSGDIEPIGDRTTPGKRAWAARHGYDFECFRQYDSGSHPSWRKLELIEQRLQRYASVIWLDADAIITNPNITVSSILDASKASIIASMDWGPCSEGQSHVHFSAGIVIFRRDPIAFKILAAAKSMTQFRNAPLWDQSAIQEVIRDNSELRSGIDILPRRILNAVPSEIQPTAQEPWQPGDFIAHLTGTSNTRRSSVIDKYNLAHIDAYLNTNAYGISEWDIGMAIDKRHACLLRELLLGKPWDCTLEIGVYHGRSSLAFVAALNNGTIKHAHFSDIHFCEQFKHVLNNVTDQSKVTLHERPANEVMSGDINFDFIFVDGNHTLAVVKKEAILILNILPECVVLHDITAQIMGLPGSDGPPLLMEALQHAGYHCLMDARDRPGEMTKRGMLVACKTRDTYEVALSAYRYTCW